jgi:DNA-binding PucR family transcriptional regulator
MGISSNQMGIYNQKTNFDKALSAMEMAKTRGQTYCYYDELGIYKVLYAVNEKTVLREYYKEVIGNLENYDRENATDLTGMLRAYLENNGSLQTVAEKQFVHRNTVTNQLKKIEEITGLNPLELEDKVILSLAFYVKQIL